MSAWKQFERDVAQVLGGKRYWANSGASLDVESETTVAQCKLVKTMSLSALHDLAVSVAKEGQQKFKVGLVAIKLRRGHGQKTTTLYVLAEPAYCLQNGTQEESAP